MQQADSNNQDGRHAERGGGSQALKPQYALNLQWTFGFNKDISAGVQNLSDGIRKLIFYASGNTAVLYDYDTGKQHLLQGHTNYIKGLASTPDCRWICSGDCGADSMVIIWDTMPYMSFYEEEDDAVKAIKIWNLRNIIPLRTIFSPHGDAGITAVDFSADGKYLVTLGADSPQTLCVWDWMKNSESPLFTAVLELTDEQQDHHNVKFNPKDSASIVSTGRDNVLFYRWAESGPEAGLKCFVPQISSKAFQQPRGFSDSCFVGSTTTAVSSTLDGDLVVWDNRSLNNRSQQLPPGQYTVTKLVKVMPNCAITVVTCLSDQQVVVGGEDGNIKFFDAAFRLVLWAEKLKTGPVLSLKFSSNAHNINPTESQPYPIATETHLPELIVSTRHGRVLRLFHPFETSDGLTSATKVEATTLPLQPKCCPARPQAEVILQAPFGKVGGAAVHPTLPLYAVGANNGTVQLWNFNTKKIVGSRKFERAQEIDTYDEVQKRQRTEIIIDTLQITALQFSNSGTYLAVGFANGQYKVVFAENLQDVPQFAGTVSSFAVDVLAFDASTSYLAIADAHQNVSVVEKVFVPREDGDFGDLSTDESSGEFLEPTKAVGWTILGKTRAHDKRIVGLEFFYSSSGALHLISVSHDQYAAVFDISKSSAAQGLNVVVRQRLSQTAVPSGLLRYSGLDSVSNAPFFLIPNSENKFKLFNPQTLVCRKTVLGPVNAGGEVTNIAPIPNFGNYLAYGMRDKVVGLMKLPLDGNPQRYVGLVGHPGGIKHVAASSDGQVLITFSDSCASVNLWSMNFAALEAQFALSGEGLTPFLNLFDPSGLGVESPLYKEFNDYFYYAQLKAQGEDSKNDRQISDVVDVSQIEPLMNAMGYYPTKEEINDMINEVKYGQAESNSQIRTTITFPELIRLYVNNRPVKQLSEADLLDALQKIQTVDYLVQGKVSQSGGTFGSESVISKAGLIAALQQTGEAMSQAELEEKLGTLMTLLNIEKTGLEIPEALSPMRQLPKAPVPNTFKAGEFISEVLGFETEDGPAAAAEPNSRE